MLEQDYLMRMILMLAAAIREALLKGESGADRSEMDRMALEDAIGMAADMDASVLLALEPESVSTVLLLGQVDDSVAEYLVHAMMLDASYLEEDGYADMADLRRRQADSVAESFGLNYEPGRLPQLLEVLDDQSQP